MDQPTAALIGAAIGFAGGIGSTLIANAFQVRREQGAWLRRERKAITSTIILEAIAITNSRKKALADGKKDDTPDLANLQAAIMVFRLVFSDEITDVSRAEFYDVANKFGKAIAADNTELIETHKWNLLNYIDAVARKGLGIREVTKWT